jgi:hypothetical protein
MVFKFGEAMSKKENLVKEKKKKNSILTIIDQRLVTNSV